MEKAIMYALNKHEGQKRKDGTPYIFHPLDVALRVKKYGEDYVYAALFHDLLEDTDATCEEILALSNEKVLEAVKLVTKTKGYDEKEYIDNIVNNEIARTVKIYDRIANLEEARTASDEFIKRYLEDTRNYYLEAFANEELNRAYEELKKTYEERE